jgi:hypothetical protein
MIGLELSHYNKFAAAYTNNNQTILLEILIQFNHLYRLKA